MTIEKLDIKNPVKKPKREGIETILLGETTDMPTITANPTMIELMGLIRSIVPLKSTAFTILIQM
ncbi:MAG: hypothetical protein L6N95_04430 [Candidatus Methylarchaceae archaeon HK01B]|nr:hypothetical protein [Candidatus Methylarchaceae archaeon HK01B]